MNKSEVMKQLESLGSEQTRKTYARHGVTGPMFGVKYGDLARLVKAIGTDQKLADQLWATGNHDARVLATMIADPAQMSQTTLDTWVKSSGSKVDADAVSKLAMKTKYALKCFEKWTKSKHEWTATAGWQVLAGGCCSRRGEVSPEIGELPDVPLEKQLQHIEKNIHKSQNYERHAMNAALIGIGLRSAALRKKALDAAKRIGKVEVDHGDTACKTPDAQSYIMKASQRGRPAAAKKTTAKKTTKKVAARR